MSTSTPADNLEGKHTRTQTDFRSVLRPRKDA